MKSMRSRDNNLFFNYDRADLIGPQTKGNQLILEFGATKQDWSQIERPSGRDQNTFFRLRKTLQPTLRTRIIKDLDPLTRVIGSLPTTKKERQATTVVAAIEGILTGLKNFMSSPVKDATGNPVIDPITNRPVIQVRTITEILEVSHALLGQMFLQNNVVLGPVFQNIVNSLTVESTVNIMENIRDIVKLNPGMSEAEKSKVWKNEIMVERIDKDDEVKANSKLSEDIPKAILDQKTNDGDWKKILAPLELPDGLLRPVQWRQFDKRKRYMLIDFITTLESRDPDVRLFGVTGTRLSYPSSGDLSRALGRQFGNDAFLVLRSLEFIPRTEVPVGRRDVPPP